MIRILFFGLLLVVALFACENDDSYVGIGVEEPSVALDPKGDSVIVKTKGVSVEVLGTFFNVEAYPDTIVEHINRDFLDTVLINGFTIIKMDKNVFVKVGPNNTGEDRKINIKLMKAHNQDYLTITQAKNE